MAVGFRNLKRGSWFKKPNFIEHENYNASSLIQNVTRSDSSGATKFNSYTYHRSCPTSGKVGFGTYNTTTKTITFSKDFYNLAYLPFSAPSVNPGNLFKDRKVEDSDYFRSSFSEGMKFSREKGLFYKKGDAFYGLTLSMTGTRPAIIGNKFTPFCWNKNFYENGPSNIYVFNNRIEKNGTVTNFPATQKYLYMVFQARGGNGGKAQDTGWWSNGRGVEGGSGAYILARIYLPSTDFIRIVVDGGISVYYNSTLAFTLGRGGNASGATWGQRGLVNLYDLSNIVLYINERGRGVASYGTTGNITELAMSAYTFKGPNPDDSSIYFDGYSHNNCFPSRLADGGHRGGSGRGGNGSYGSGGGGGGYDAHWFYVDRYDGGTGGSAYINIGF